jgi:hypothetical protein
MIVLATEYFEVYFHALRTMTEQFKLYELKYCLIKLHCCSETTSVPWDAPDYPTCPLSPRSNSAMKCNDGTNRIQYQDISAQTITETPPCFTFGTEPSIPDFGLSWVF